jgi:hypothetical protein
METILLRSITVDELLSKIREIIKEEIKAALQPDQFLTKAF